MVFALNEVHFILTLGNRDEQHRPIQDKPNPAKWIQRPKCPVPPEYRAVLTLGLVPHPITPVLVVCAGWCWAHYPGISSPFFPLFAVSWTPPSVIFFLHFWVNSSSDTHWWQALPSLPEPSSNQAQKEAYTPTTTLRAICFVCSEEPKAFLGL